MLLVRYCKPVVNKAGAKDAGLKEGATIKRKKSTIDRGKPERLLWSDESARAGYVPSSKFMGRKPVSGAPKDEARES